MSNTNDLKSQNLIDELDIDELYKSIEESESNLDNLQLEQDELENPENLDNRIKSIIWQQFQAQLGVKIGEEFIQENNDKTLDLSKDAHIQTTENFEHGKIADHNTKINYEERYTQYMNDFQTDPNIEVKMSSNMIYDESDKTYKRYDKTKGAYVPKQRYNEETGIWEDYDVRSSSWKKRLAHDARKKFDTRDKKQMGNKTIAKDHTISAAEQIRDAEAAAHVDRETRKEFAKSDANLNDLDAAANQSKADLSMTKWLDKPRQNGESQAEYYGLDENELRNQDKVAREEEQKIIDEGKQASLETGKQSRKEEAMKAGKSALKALVLTLLAELLRTIVQNLIVWIKSKNKSFSTFIDQLKKSIEDFINNLKNHLISMTDVVVTTIVTSIIGPIVGTIKKVWMIIKQGGIAIKDSFKYLTNPENKNEPLEMKLLQVGKILIAGTTVAGSVVLSEVIEKALLVFPPLGINIPLLGSLANVLGIFFGAITAGITGAILINSIDKYITKKRKNDILSEEIDNKNEILVKTDLLEAAVANKTFNTKLTTAKSVSNRHMTLKDELNSLVEAVDNNDFDFSEDQDEIERMLEELQ